MPQKRKRNKDKEVIGRVESKRFNRRVYQRVKKRLSRREAAERKQFKKQVIEKELGVNFTYQDVINKWLPTNLLYILKCQKCEMNEDNLRNDKVFRQVKPAVRRQVLYIPEVFSLIDAPKECFAFFREAILALLFGNYKEVFFSYKNCKKLDVGAQIILDIIKKESLTFIKRCARQKNIKRKSRAAKQVGITDVHYTKEEIRKILTSIGSLAIHAKTKREFKDIIPYELCIHNREEEYNRVKAIEQKDIDTTALADYVIKSLARFNKTLTPEKLDDLCTIIGEILINAEEHSTTHHRFSIGYFQDIHKDGKHVGIFRLVILNFGKTIYETFAESDSPNIEIIDKMRQLSKKYTSRGLFSFRKFEEENLWTLYALQEGVTSIPDKRRGNGSIQFIDSFFSLKGNATDPDEKSRMTILSGHTRITFDGTYRIQEKDIDGQKFKVMTFNNSGNIEDAPDKKFVKYKNNYFPGTIISARIFLSEDDFEHGTD